MVILYHVVCWVAWGYTIVSPDSKIILNLWKWLGRLLLCLQDFWGKFFIFLKINWINWNLSFLLITHYSEPRYLKISTLKSIQNLFRGAYTNQDPTLTSFLSPPNQLLGGSSSESNLFRKHFLVCVYIYISYLLPIYRLINDYINHGISHDTGRLPSPGHFAPPSGHTEGRQRHQEAGAEKHLEGKHFFTSEGQLQLRCGTHKRPQGAIKILFEDGLYYIYCLYHRLIGHIRDWLLLSSQH